MIAIGAVLLEFAQNYMLLKYRNGMNQNCPERSTQHNLTGILLLECFGTLKISIKVQTK